MLKFEKDTIDRYVKSLKEKSVTPNEIKRKLKSLSKFLDWTVTTGYLDQNDFKQMEGEIAKSVISPSNLEGQLKSVKISPNRFQPISADFNRSQPISTISGIQNYIAFAVILLLISLIGFGLYNQFFKKTATPFAYPAALTAGSRIISFQGRLTDSIGNPIIAPIDLTYSFYTVSTGGSPITGSTRVCTASPDQDGVFANLIGSDPGPSCTPQLPATIFSENPQVWLGVTVGSELTEMSPRQQIANVGYAMNAETLQGFPPGTTVSTIPFISTQGDLLIAAATPGIRSTYTTANFVISSAKTTTIQSANAGDIVLSATDGGALRFNTYNGSLVERITVLSGGNVGISNVNPRAAFDVIGSASLSANLAFSGATTQIGQLNGGNISFATSPGGDAGLVTKMTLTNLGNLGIGSTLPAYLFDVSGGSGIVGQFSGRVIGGNAVNGNEFATLGQIAAGGGQYWQRTNGALSPATLADDVLLGATSTSSAKFAFMNVNAGTPTASISGNLAIAAPSGLNPATSYDIFNGGTFNLRTSPGGDIGLASRLFVNNAGNVGIGTALPSSLAHLYSTSTSTSFTGFNLDWSPGSSTTTTGDLFALNIGTNGTASTLFNVKDTSSSLFSVSETAVTSNLPTSFTSAGDVSIAYDLLFTNPTSSYIKSSAPLYIQAGEVFNSSDLTLTTYNSGDVVLDAAGGVTLAQAQPWSLATSTTALNIQSGLLNIDTTNTRVGIGTTAPTEILDIVGNASASGNITLGQTGALRSQYGPLNLAYKSALNAWTNGLTLKDVSGNVGIGSTNPSVFKLEVAGNIGPEADNTRDLGSSSRYYANIYANNIVGSGALGYWKRGVGTLYPNVTSDAIAATSSGTTVATFTATGTNDALRAGGSTNYATFNSSGNLTFTNAGVATITGPTTGLTIDATTGALNFGTSANARTITIGNVTTSTAVNVNTGTAGTTYTTTNGIFTLNTGTGTISLGTDAVAKTITIGNATTTTALALNSGTGDIVLTSTDQVKLNSSKAAGGTTTEALSLKSTVDLGVADELLQIGDSAADFLTILGNGNVGIGSANPSAFKLEVAGNIGPEADNTRDLGSSSRYYANIYANNIVGSGALGYWKRGVGTLYPNVTSDAIAATSSGTTVATFTATGTNDALRAGGSTNYATFNSSGNLTFTNAGVATITGPTTGLTIDATTGALNFGTTANARIVTLGNVTTTTAVNVNTGTGGTTHTTTNGIYTLNTGTGTISLGTDAVAKTITIGNATTTTALALNSGSGDIVLTSTDQVKLNSSKAAGGTTTEALSLKSTVDLGVADELLQIGDSAADFLTILGNGNVGIGSANPSAFKLEVAGNIGPEADNTRDLGSSSRYYANIYANNIVGSGALGYWKRGVGTLYPNVTSDAIAATSSGTTVATFTATGSNDAARIGGSTNYATINASGNLTFTNAGVATITGPTTGLTIDATTGALNFGTTANARIVTLGNVTTTTAVNVNTGTGGTTHTTTNGVYTLNTGTGTISLGTDAVAKTITIGNATTTTALALNSGTGDIVLTSTDQVKLNSSKAAGGTTTEALSLKSTVDLGVADELLQIGDSAADFLTILGNGNVGIGSANPSAFKLEVAGNIGPEADNTRDLGSSSRYYANIYANNIVGSGALGYWKRGVGTLYPNVTSDAIAATSSGTTVATFTATGSNDAARIGGSTNYATINASGNLTFTNAGVATITGPTTGLTIDATTGALNFGTSANARTITIGNVTTSTAVNVNTGTAGTTYTTTNGIFTLNTGTGTISLGTDAVAKTITIGNATTTTGLALNSGTGDIVLTSTDQVKLNSSKAAGGTTTEALSLKSTVDLGVADELLQIGDSAADFLTILGNGNVGIGTALPSSLAHLYSTSTSTSFTGFNLDWSPGSGTTTTGDLFALNIGTNGSASTLFNVKDTGSSLFSVSETAVTSNLPTSFTSAGDVSIAYDLLFTNPTSSYIKSSAPLYIQAGEVFNSSDLTLTTYNSGDVVFDAAGGVTLAQAQPWSLATSTTALNIQSGLLNIDTTNTRVGIGTTAPTEILDVVGNASASGNITLGQTGALRSQYGPLNLAYKSALNAWTNGLTLQDTTGNVGVGSSNPLQKLHVEGQCVTGDTLLRRRRRKLKGKSSKFKGGGGPDPDEENLKFEIRNLKSILNDEMSKNSNIKNLDLIKNLKLKIKNCETQLKELEAGFTWEDVRIDQIQEGDEILTLDENTGEFVPQEVEKLMDMGKQEVFGLKTSTGKWIKTTANHPYLVQVAPPTYVTGTFEVDISGRIEEMNKDSFMALANNQASYVIKISKQVKQILKLIHRKKHSTKFGFQIYAHLIRQLIVFSGYRVRKLLIDHDYSGNEQEIAQIIMRMYPDISLSFRTIGKHSPAHNAAYESNIKGVGINKILKIEEYEAKKNETQAALKGAADGTDHQEWIPGFPSHKVSSSMYHNDKKMSRGKTQWIKVANLRVGTKIATVDGWEYIIDIIKMGKMQTYDIQVANTHNFVGNDIVAHNTYISGNTGIGSTSPTSFKLEVAGNIGPDADNTRNIGAVGRAYNTIYVNNIVGSGGLGYWSRGTGVLFPTTTTDGVAATTSATTVATFTATGSNDAARIGGSTNYATINASGNLTFTNAGVATITGPTSGLTIDATTGAMNFGTSANARVITIGNATTTTGLALNSGTGDIVLTSTDQVKLNSSKAAGGTTTEVLSLKSTVDLGVADELLQIGDSAADFMTILGNGNVGIGLALPLEKLDIVGNASASGNITLGQTGVLRSQYGPLNLAYKSGLNAWTTGLTLKDSTGYVGIGTTGPQRSLHVFGGSGADSAIIGSRYQVNGTDYGDLSSSAGVGLVAVGNYGGKYTNLPTNPLGTQWTTSGVVGIATGDSGSAYAYGVSGLARADALTTGRIAGGYFNADANAVLNAAESFYGVYSTALGTTNTAGTDNVYGIYSTASGQGTDITYGGYFSGSGGGTNYGVYSAGGTNYFSGNVGIGTTGPLAQLDVKKSITIDVVNSLARFGYDTGGLTNRSIVIEQIGNAGTANQFIFLNGHLGSSSVTGTPTLTSTYAPSFGIESNDSNLNLITAAAGTNVAVTRALSINSSGNVGIGTTGPGNKLEVYAGADAVETAVLDLNGAVGTVGVGKYIEFANGQAGIGWVNNAGSIAGLWMGASTASKTLYVGTTGTTAGSVGIGTTSPAVTSLLDLTSTAKGFLAPRMTTVQRDAIVTPATGLMIYNTTTNAYNVYNGTSWGTIGGGVAGSGTLNYVTKWTPDGATLGNSVIYDTGTNVGIGTTVPATKFNVAGENVEISMGRTSTDTNQYTRLGQTTAYDSYFANNAFNNAGTWNYVNTGGWGGLAQRLDLASGNFYFDTTSGGTNPITWSTKMFIANGGNVGIGTTSPGTTLHVIGAGAVPNANFNTSMAVLVSNTAAAVDVGPTLRFAGESGNGVTPYSFGAIQGAKGSATAADYQGLLKFFTSNAAGGNMERMRIDGGGNIGIGTTGPVTNLSVYNANESTTLTNFTQALTNAGLNIMTNYTGSAYTPGVFWSTSDNNATKPKAGIWLLEDGSGTDIYFGTSNDYATGITNNGLVLDQTGNVGIGTTGPLAKLDTRGSILTQSNLNINDTGLTGLCNSDTRSSVIFGTTDSVCGFWFGSQTSDIRANTTLGIYSWQMANWVQGWKPNGDSYFNYGVGVGTSNIDQALDVYESGQGTSAIKIKSDQYASWPSRGELGSLLFGVDGGGSGTPVIGEVQSMAQGDGGYSLLFRAHNGSSLTDVMSILGSGSVGIGTTSPGRLLSVVSTTSDALVQMSRASNAYLASLELKTGATQDWLVGTRDTTNSDYHLYSFGTAADAMTVLRGNGNVGIGSTAPTAKLDIAGNLNVQGYATASASLSVGGFNAPGGVGNALFSGNVGIGTSSPTSRFFVNLGSNQLARFNDGSSASGATFQNGSILSQSSQFQIAATSTNPLSFYTGATINSMTPGTERIRVATTGNVGIGGALNTNAQLDLNGGTILAGQFCPTSTCLRYVVPNGISRIDQLQISSDLPNSTGYISFLDVNNSYVPIASISAQATGTVVIDNTATNITDVGYPSVPDLCVGDPYWCTGKIDAGTIDPPYTINGKKYATFLSAMTGVKEETTGTVATNFQFEIRNLKSNSNDLISKGYAVKVIDFNDLPEASDLWLFSKTTNLRKNLGKMTVLLTPSDDTRTWYKVDNATHSLTIYSSRPTTISYRLTAPRFDGERWTNENPGGSGGFELNDPDQPSLVALNQAGDVPPETFTISPIIANDASVIASNTSVIPSGVEGSLHALTLGRDDIVKAYKVISDKTGDFIEEVGVFAQITVGQIKAGFIETENAIVNNMLYAKNIVANTVRVNSLFISDNLFSQKIISPVVETTDLKTDTIKPKNKDLTIDLNDVGVGSSDPNNTDGQTGGKTPPLQGNGGALAKLIIKGLNNQTVASIDSAGNATFAGTLTASEASISGTLTTQSIVASSSSFLTSDVGRLTSDEVYTEGLQSRSASISGKLIAREIESDTISELAGRTAAVEEAALMAAGKTAAVNEGLAENINIIQQELAQIKNNPLPDPNYYQNIDANVRVGSSDPNVTGGKTPPLQNLTVIGNSNLYNASVANSLMAGNIFIQNNEILSLSWELKLSALAQITLFDGSVTIAKNGNITTEGMVIAKGGIRTDTIQPTENSKDVTFKLPGRTDAVKETEGRGTASVNEANGKLKIENSEGNEVASIDASGSAKFNALGFNQIATNSAIIADSGLRTTNDEIIPAMQTNAEAAGQGILPLGAPEIIIYNDKITKDSLVYLTKTGDTGNEPLTVVKKEAGERPYFSVSAGNSQHGEIKFNWLIIN